MRSTCTVRKLQKIRPFLFHFMGGPFHGFHGFFLGRARGGGLVQGGPFHGFLVWTSRGGLISGGVFTSFLWKVMQKLDASVCGKADWTKSISPSRTPERCQVARSSQLRLLLDSQMIIQPRLSVALTTWKTPGQYICIQWLRRACGWYVYRLWNTAFEFMFCEHRNNSLIVLCTKRFSASVLKTKQFHFKTI